MNLGLRCGTFVALTLLILLISGLGRRGNLFLIIAVDNVLGNGKVLCSQNVPQLRNKNRYDGKQRCLMCPKLALLLSEVPICHIVPYMGML